MSTIKPVRRALLSVSNKVALQTFASALHAMGVELLSTGGTATLLLNSGIPVTEVSEYTKFPEMMDGRVKTLHPRIHGGILGRRGTDDEVMNQYEIVPIDMVVVNLYPFAQTVAQPDCTLYEAIENIDIGGPAMVRAAAKNHQDVAIITDPDDYDRVLKSLTSQAGLTLAQRFDLAVKAFEHTAAYDGMIANYLGCRVKEGDVESFSRTINLHFEKVQDMRYGENPHQKAAFYREKGVSGSSVPNAVQIQGKALSYNNVADTDAALECVKQFKEPACVIVKHANPCGVAIAETIAQAYEGAFKTDPTSAFGGIIAFNRPLDGALLKHILDRQFVEVIIAPKISDDAKRIGAEKKNVRMLECGSWADELSASFHYTRVKGGLLVQDKDTGMIADTDLKVVTKAIPSPGQINDLLFAWKVAKFVKSNAIVYCRDLQTIGIGAGQMSRVYSAKIAGIKARDEGLEVSGSVMASDAFFPFRDGIDSAAEAGISAVVQPGGSMRDHEVIAAADEHGMAMVFTGMRHFRH